jgi:hypothetical protein
MTMTTGSSRSEAKAAKQTPTSMLFETFAKANRQQMALLIFFIVQIIGLTVFQKMGIPVKDKLLEICLPTMLIGMAALTYWVRPKIDHVRAGLYILFCMLAFISSLFQTGGQSTTSFLLALAIYAPFMFYYEVSPKLYRSMIEIFILVMMAAGVIVLLQHAVQFALSWQAWPNLDKMLPESIMMQSFVYIQPISPTSHFMKPNGIFFLEVSMVSQFTALALILEVVYFQRLLQTSFLVGILLACFAGTGLLMLLLTLPFLMTQFNRRTWILIAVAFGVSLAVATEIGWLDQVQHRFTEYQHNNTSANHRFIAPWKMLTEFLRQDDAIYTGWGAGSMLKAPNVVWWPFTKVTVEYGLLTAIAFHALFIYSLFVNTPNWRASVGFFVFYSFMGGGFLVPVYPMICMLFCATFRMTKERKSRRRRSSSSGSSSSGSSGSSGSSSGDPQRRRRRRSSSGEPAGAPG